MRKSYSDFNDNTALLRQCNHKDCVDEGLYRAPRSREDLEDYYWFCLIHVRAYNAQWDYYVGMNEKEINDHRRQDLTWQRPTWPLGADSVLHMAVLDRESFYHSIKKGFSFEPAPAPVACQFVDPKALEALKILHLSQPLTMNLLKQQYRTLAKKHHPDNNQGCSNAEEKLKNIIRAYSLLKELLDPA